MYFAFPLLFSDKSLHHFTEKVVQTPELGRQVCVLSMANLFHMASIEEDLCSLIPHLTSLRHFIGTGSLISYMIPYMSIKAFTLLAEAAGNSLVSITKLELRYSSERLPPAVLNSFKKLIKLDITASPQVEAVHTELDPESLPNLRELRLCGASGFLDMLSVLKYATAIVFSSNKLTCAGV
jgi:hypothetical protein